MAETAHVGLNCDCPHCFAQLEVPSGDEVNKDRFVEPPGLRRLLKEVKDREWEILRRKLKASVARTAELESELHRAHTVIAEKAVAAKPSDDKAKEAEALQRQVSDLSDKFHQANLAFMASRKQQDTVIEHLRRELENARGESQGFKKKNEDLARQLQNAMQMFEATRLAASIAEDVPKLQGEVIAAQEALAECQRKLEAEQAKVILMEAAAMTIEPPEAPKKGKNDELLKELQIQISELRKENRSLRGARDRANAEAAELRKQAEATQEKEAANETALGDLEGSLEGVLMLVSSRRKPKKAAVK
jgi:chromosome segregation ATPase